MRCQTDSLLSVTQLSKTQLSTPLLRAPRAGLRLSALAGGPWSLPGRWHRAPCWEGRTSPPPQPLVSRFWHKKQIPGSQLGCARCHTAVILTKCTASRGVLSCPGVTRQQAALWLAYLPPRSFYPGLVQSELRACGMFWSLLPAPVGWTRDVVLPPRRMALRTSVGFAGWDWAGVFFSKCFSAGDVGQTLRFCTGTDEIEAI